MTAQEIFDGQKEADRRHHRERIEWLSEPQPKYADGVPVSKYDIHKFMMQSKSALADESGMSGYNTGTP